MKQIIGLLTTLVTLAAYGEMAEAQQAKVYRVGVIYQGGPYKALKAGEADAYFYTADAMMASQAQLIIEMARDKRWPTMFDEAFSVAQGGLASYGISYYEAGRLSAKYVRRILTGTSPRELAVETLHKLEFVINLKTAKQIGLTIPPNMLARADKVIK